jgi:hypothetical protein
MSNGTEHPVELVDGVIILKPILMAIGKKYAVILTNEILTYCRVSYGVIEVYRSDEEE